MFIAMSIITQLRSSRRETSYAPKGAKDRGKPIEAINISRLTALKTRRLADKSSLTNQRAALECLERQARNRRAAQPPDVRKGYALPGGCD